MFCVRESESLSSIFLTSCFLRVSIATTSVPLVHATSEKGIAIDVKKTKAINSLKPPQNVKELGRFLGKIKWHARFIQFMVDLACPLYGLMRKDAKYEWIEAY